MLITISGASGTGKSTIGKIFEQNGIKQVVSHTTREMRKGEVHGQDYYYVSKEEFGKLDLIEQVEYSSNLYGFTKSELDKAINSGDIYFVIVNYDGYNTMVDYLGKENVYSIYVDFKNGSEVSEFTKELSKRMKERGDSEEHIQSRIDYYLDTIEVENKLREISDYIIYNDKWDDTYEEVIYLIDYTFKK